MARDYSHYRSFKYKAGGAARTRAPQDLVWEVVAGIGGEDRYYTMNYLWTVREMMDAAVGGPGMRRTRPVGHEPRPGDHIDSWEVLVADRPRRLALIFGMKAPGRGVLEFDLARLHGRTRLTATAYWQPDGFSGLLYWRAMQPAHLVLFDRLTSEICRRAEDRARDLPQPAGAAPLTSMPEDATG
ncbi:uncharacterized protein DUF2867 [Rhodothalassium salexigens DSM 2132]|uniref:Uncharacterized protein DUF2867 n=1 Tax=Rhodothalassium salexigens DSM 2132 TaxID=1188247 RepID=A0A4R2PEY9_RHOSA|nr:DUF2867 domain-containing protein [Rhodothalassium salexigens]MBB4212164.1 hypothetical protein [Rhodothalassium salexigens DSM 2132]MBK1638169.1 hypothetical protein [Rhodothalassium salexigens DSM 2132]TCP33038.1 uncharacterized protein DUF2867 [Rhodothalassium salexigens DSM 2132]